MVHEKSMGCAYVRVRGEIEGVDGGGDGMG